MSATKASSPTISKEFVAKVILFFLTTGILAYNETWAADKSTPPLAGSVTSAEEGRMEGVMVSAKAVGSPITVTVASDSKGLYVFPEGKLQPGKYHVTIRAVGYEVQNLEAIEVSGATTVNLDLKLHKTKNDWQLMNAEWLASIPGTEAQKKKLSLDCDMCHAYARITHTEYDSDGFKSVLLRMRNHASNSLFIRPVDLPNKVQQLRPADLEFAKYLPSINLSSGQWTYDLKIFPRLTGRSNRVVITEYDLPRRDSQPHDVAVDSQGVPWYPDTSRAFLAKVDPRTGEVKEWPLPVPRPDFPDGGTDIKFDKQGNPWIGRVNQPGVTKFDKETSKMTMYRIPSEYENANSMAGQIAISPDGNYVWGRDYGNRKIYKWDAKSGRADVYSTPVTFYGLETNSLGNLYLASLDSGSIGELDAETGKVQLYQPPTANSGPRRGDMDSKDRFWFAEYNADKIGVFDTRTKQFKEWPVPGPWAGPYDVVVDKNGEVWSAGMHTDYIYRLDPKTGQVTRYLLPTVTANMRRIDVDNSTTPVSIWVGESHQAKIARIQPLD